MTIYVVAWHAQFCKKHIATIICATDPNLYALSVLYLSRYDVDGHCVGSVNGKLMAPIRLQWNIPEACQEVIESSLRVARNIANDVDMHLEVIRGFGKGVMKKCRISPDAFIQMSLQLAYYRVKGYILLAAYLCLVCCTYSQRLSLSNTSLELMVR